MTSTDKVTDSFYVLLDLRSNSQDLNDPHFTHIEFNLVDQSDFVSKGSAVYEESSDEPKSEETLQKFLQKLIDLIHSVCISKNKTFVFVVTSGWDFRIKFIKLAKSVETQLPLYLEYPAYFDLKKEFIKFEEQVEMVPFNSIEYNSATLELMRTKLKIDEKTKGIQLMIEITKEITLQANGYDILKTPHDMNLDLSHFFTEKSKILYLNNLSSDITQVELETFFIQFGGHAMAFWLLKNPVLIDSQTTENIDSTPTETTKTCSGFVIFSTHEDAIQALAMSGTLFNEKLVEIQPSSLTILDKARDILSPFPSSKNKPRPGDWNCPSCGFSNFQRRTACFRCSFPAASAATVQESMYSNDNNLAASSGSNQKPKNDYNINTYNSIPPTTNNFNANNYNNNSIYGINNMNLYGNGGCSYGNTNYSGNYNSQGYNNNTTVNNNGYSNNNNNNSNSGYSSRQSSNVPFRAGDWKCINETCAYHNFAKNICCLKCGAPRVPSAIVNGHAHGQHNNNNHNNVTGSEKHNGKNPRNYHLMDSNNSSRSGSITNQMTNISQHVNTGQNQSMGMTQSAGQNQGNNFNKLKNNVADVFTNSTPNTPAGTRSSGNLYYNNNTSSDFELISRIGGLSLNNNNTGENSVGSSLSGASGIPLMNNTSGPESNNNINLNGFNNINSPFSTSGIGGLGSNLGMGSNEFSGVGNLDMSTFGISNLNMNTMNSLNTMNIMPNMNNMNNLNMNSLGTMNNIGNIGGNSNKMNDMGMGLPLDMEGMNIGINSNMNLSMSNIGGLNNYNNMGGLGSNNDVFGSRLGGGLGRTTSSPAMSSSGGPLPVSNMTNSLGLSSLSGEFDRKNSGSK